jgi:hypothetical protein
MTDIILNRGGAGALDLIRTKYQIMAGSFMMKLCRALWGTTPQNTSIDIDNIDAWVGQTNNVIAGIDRSQAANSWWLPQSNYPIGAVLTAALGEPGYQNAVFGYDEPDTFIMDQTRFANFKTGFLALVRFTEEAQDKEALQVGFRYHFVWNNATVLADRFCPASVGYLINSNYIFPVFHEADYFTVDPFIKPSNQRVVTSTCYLTWNLICPSPRMNIKFTTLT